MKIACPPSLVRLAAMLPAPLYVVGGFVRNALLWGDVEGTDIDICGPMTVESLQNALAADPEVQVIPVNPRVGTVLVRYRGEAYEYTTFRRDSYPVGGVHTPQSVQFVSSPAEDASRRDFCVNALYVDVRSGEVLDPTEGLADLSAHLLRTTRTPAAVFAEDGLRILRLVRFAAELGFEVHPDALRVAGEMRGQLKDISPERKREEFNKILMADTRYGQSGAWLRGLSLLNTLRLWPYLLGVQGSLVLKDESQKADTVGGNLVHMSSACRLRPIGDLAPELNLRLAAVCLQMATAMGADPAAFASRALGQNGLRYANATVADVCMRLRAVTELLLAVDCAASGELMRIWQLWAAKYGPVQEGILPLLQNDVMAEHLRLAWQSLLFARVPLTHKDLPLSPNEIAEMGVPQAELGRVMQRILQMCATKLLRPTKEDVVNMIERIKGENKWN